MSDGGPGRGRGSSAEAHAATVVAEDLAVAYAGRARALEGVSFAVGPGRSVGVLGPNAGGKTTLLRALLGELRPSGGRVAVRGRPAYVSQGERSRLDFPIDARGVVLMGAYARTPWHRRITRAERRAAGEALERVGLGDQARVPYGRLSGGQRQRVLLARALRQEAAVLLLDEPLSGVDRASAARILDLLGELRDEGRTLLVATHDINEARRFDAVLCLNRRQVAFGPPAEVLTPDVLGETYGAEIVLLAGGARAVAVQHHQHGGP